MIVEIQMTNVTAHPLYQVPTTSRLQFRILCRGVAERQLLQEVLSNRKSCLDEIPPLPPRYPFQWKEEVHSLKFLLVFTILKCLVKILFSHNFLER